VTKDANKFEQFGGSVGGPIWKNKIFAFFNYETVREPTSNQQANVGFETTCSRCFCAGGKHRRRSISLLPRQWCSRHPHPNANLRNRRPYRRVKLQKRFQGQGINVGTSSDDRLGYAGSGLDR